MASDSKKAVDRSGIHPATAARINKLSTESSFRYNNGLGGSYIVEPVPIYLQTESEEVWSNKNGAFIVLGRDRPGNRLTGYGGVGDTQAASIDIVVGRMGSKPKQVTEEGEKIFAEPDIKIDAARIYISQKTDVDDNFNLSDGTIGSAKARSAIALKADGVRIISREGIKLVTTTDKLNSQGGKVKSRSGIDLIAGNDSAGLQPLVKGDNLVEGIDKIIGYIESLTEIVQGVVTAQMALNTALASHTHVIPPIPVVGPPPFFPPIGSALGGATLPDPAVITTATSAVTKFGGNSLPGLSVMYANMVFFTFNYLRNPSSSMYILSRHNNTN
jgi:hypothetical protein